MKRFLTPLLAALALPPSINAGINPEIHKLCKDVSDYMGCVKANSKNNSWNPFKNDTKEKKSKNSFQLSKAEKEKWCNYKNLNKENKQVLNRCIENLEALGPKFSSISFENHKKCFSTPKNSPNLSSYISCLEMSGDKSIYSLVKGIKSEDIARIDYLQLKSDWEKK